jgi:hypothetical protein
VEDPHVQLRKWTGDGIWERILAKVIVKDDAVGAVEWTFSIDREETPPGPHRTRRTPTHEPSPVNAARNFS